MYDVTRRDTFEKVELWLEMFREHHSGDAVSILVGNKIDLKGERDVDREQGERRAKECGISFCEISAKTGEGVEALFYSIIENIRTTPAGYSSPDLDVPLTEKQLQRKRESATSINKTKLVKI